MPEEGREIYVNEELMNITRTVFYYGCYSAKDFKKMHGISNSSFNRYKQFLQYIFEDYFQETTSENCREKVPYFRIDEFKTPFNILLDLYSMKKILPIEAILFIKLMLFFTGRNEKKQFTFNNLHTQIHILKDKKKEEYISDRTFKRKLEEIADYGYLTCEGKGTFKYSFPKDILITLDDTNLYRLNALTDFCKNIYYPSVCAHYLTDTLSLINQEKRISYDMLFSCKPLHMGQVLEDGKLWQLLTAIYEKKLIRFDYKGKNEEKLYRYIQPHKLIINETDGRRYVFCIILKNGKPWGRLYRLDNISKMEIETKEEETPLTEEEVNQIYHELLDKSFMGTCLFQKKLQTATLIYRTDFFDEIQKYFPDANPEHVDETHDKIRIEVNSLQELNPWLRRNLGNVRMVDASDDTAEKFAKELKEWGAMYGIERNRIDE